MSVRFARIDVLRYGGRARGARGAVETWSERAGLLLRLATRDGRVGQGEASPLPRYSPDTLEAAERALKRTDFEALPVAAPGEAGAPYLERLAAATTALPPSAAFAVETALLDLLGQERGVPIWALIDGAREVPVPLCALIGGADDARVVPAALAAAARGAHTIKTKIAGPALGPELDVLARVRDSIGERPLRLDANRTFTGDTVATELERLVPLNPELVEEPAPPDALLSLPASKIPLALDESLQDPAAFDRFEPHLERLRCVALVLKPMALGGFSACLRLSRRAQAADLDVTLSHLFDGPVALAAAAHLAIAAGSRTRASGLDAHGGLDAWPRVPLPFLDSTRILAASRPGLGLDLLEEPA
ncbi:MAG TPA: enolase C-terminal domain-like protein [Polyangiaceae bacterium]|nr:enolase C-terminal domain-like protein [Polyangiaceae bacterium]